MSFKQIKAEITSFSTDYFKANVEQKLCYHNLNHTKDVLKAAWKMIRHYHLNDQDEFIIYAAVWFHDLGYVNSPNEHEQYGAKIAGDYLAKYALQKEIILAIQNCILATIVPQIPGNLLGKIVCDADLFHLGTKKFKKKNKLLFKEYNDSNDIKITKQDWRNRTILFLEEHQFQTDFCRDLLEEQKQFNLSRLKKKFSQLELMT